MGGVGGAGSDKQRAGPCRGQVGGAPGGVSSPSGAASLQPGSSPGASAAGLGKLEREDRAQPWPKLSAPAAPGCSDAHPFGRAVSLWLRLEARGHILPLRGVSPGCLTACPRCWEPHPVQARGRELHLVAGTQSHPERLQDPESHVGWGVLLGVGNSCPSPAGWGPAGWGEAPPY